MRKIVEEVENTEAYRVTHKSITRVKFDELKDGRRKNRYEIFDKGDEIKPTNDELKKFGDRLELISIPISQGDRGTKGLTVVDAIGYMSIKQVLKAVDDGKFTVPEALDAERDGKNRDGLIGELEDLAAALV